MKRTNIIRPKKSQWTAQLRQKEEEALQMKRQVELNLETYKGAIEKKQEELDTLHGDHRTEESAGTPAAGGAPRASGLRLITRPVT